METIDLYCERIGPGLLAEPVNAATNAAFFVVAWVLWRFVQRSGVASTDARALLALVVAIGIGSTLFHTFATLWARVLDQLPILLFQLAFLWVYTRRVMVWPRWAAAAAIAAYVIAALYAKQFPHLLNGSLTYAPALLMTLALGGYHWSLRLPGRGCFVSATGVLLAALVFRTLDEPVCERFPLGTHFVWHLLVAVVAYLCMRALLVQQAHGRALRHG